MSTPSKPFERSYDFLRKMEEDGGTFTMAEIATACGWSPKSPSTYLSKKWSKYVHKTTSGRYAVHGFLGVTKEQYLRLMSQRDEISRDPLRPELPEEVERLVVKSREAAMLALDVYNRPATVFRSEAYIVLMVIAWTSALHAHFELTGRPYHYIGSDGAPQMVDGDVKYWELSKCVSERFGGVTTPVRSNLEFIIQLRNKIEHRYAPIIDGHVAGECQALLLNYDDFIVGEFGEYFAIREHLAVPLQTASVRSVGQIQALRKFQGRQFEELREFIDSYRSALSNEVYQSPQYSFRVYLVPKVGNHAESSDLAYEFVKFDPSSAEDMSALRKHVALIRDRQVPVANAGSYRPGAVAKKVEAAIGRAFTIHLHTLAWKKYKVRKPGNDAAACVTKYCQFDAAHGDYVYTDAWIERLSRDLSAPSKYDELVAFVEEDPDG